MSKHGLYNIGALVFSTIISLAIGRDVLKHISPVQRQVLGAASPITLHRDMVQIHPKSVFPYFYEPKAGSTETYNPDWLGRSVTYTYNADGLNEQREYDIQKPDNTVRLMTLGDSFTFGLFVETNDNYSKKLEHELNSGSCKGNTAYEVINLGVPAYDVGYSAERFRLRGKKYNPDVVIWFLNPFTMTMLADEKQRYEERFVKELSEDQIREHEKKGEYFYPGTLAYNAVLDAYSIVEIISKEAAYFSLFTDVYDGPLVIVANRWSIWYPAAKFAIQAIAFTRPHTMLYTTLPDLETIDGVLKDKHPNEKGHALIATSLYTQLTASGLITCGN